MVSTTTHQLLTTEDFNPLSENPETTMRTKNLIREDSIYQGSQREYKFPNGYGASVVRHSFSYGGKEGKWELAVLNSNGSLDYTTEITDDVIGHLTEPEVDEILTRISKLPKKND